MGKPRGSIASTACTGAAVAVAEGFGDGDGDGTNVADGAADGVAMGARSLPPQAVAVDSATIRISSAVLRKFIRRSRQRLCRA
jgi:hypothetical protein